MVFNHEQLPHRNMQYKAKDFDAPDSRCFGDSASLLVPFSLSLACMLFLSLSPSVCLFILSYLCEWCTWVFPLVCLYSLVSSRSTWCGEDGLHGFVVHNIIMEKIGCVNGEFAGSFLILICLRRRTHNYQHYCSFHHASSNDNTNTETLLGGLVPGTVQCHTHLLAVWTEAGFVVCSRIINYICFMNIKLCETV